MNKTIKLAIFTLLLTLSANIAFAQTPTTAEGYFNLGKQQFSEKNFDGAIKSFSECLRLDANVQPCIYARGVAYFQNKQYDQSSADFSTLLGNSALSPRDKMQMLNGRMQAFCYSGKLEEAAKDEAAIKSLGGNIPKTCMQFLAENPNLRPGVVTPEEYIKRGDDLAKKDGKHQEAISNYEKALSKKNSSTDNKKDSNIYLKIAVSYSSLGDNEKSLSSLKQAIALNPENADAYGELGDAYLRNKDFVAAEANLNKAISLNPRLDTAYNRRGFIYWRVKKDKVRAIKDYEKVFEVSNSHPIALATLTQLLGLYGEDKNNEGKISAYTKYITFLEANSLGSGASYIVERAEIHLLKNDLDKAAADLNAAEKAYSLEKNVYFADKLKLYSAQSELKLAKKDYPSAIEYLTKSEQLHNSLSQTERTTLFIVFKSLADKTPIYISRANAYCLSGKKSEAKADEQKVIELGGKIENPCK